MKNLRATFAVIRIAASILLGAGPASAQSFCTCDGTGNVLVFANKAFTPQKGTIVNDNPLRAYASEGRGTAAPDSPEATGGGSTGYNEMLRNF